MDNRARMHEILDMVIDTNGLGERRREKTGFLPTVFFFFNGHVSMLDIDVCPDGWEAGCERITFSFDTSIPMSGKKIKDLRECLADSINSNDPAQTLAREIANKEKEIAEQKKKLAAMKRELTKVRKEGGAA